MVHSGFCSFCPDHCYCSSPSVCKAKRYVSYAIIKIRMCNTATILLSLLIIFISHGCLFTLGKKAKCFLSVKAVYK